MWVMVTLETARLVVIGIFTAVVALIWYLSSQLTNQNCGCLTVSFLDVGQGDAIYIRTPDNYEMLVDGGRDSSVLKQLSANRSFFARG